MAGGGIHSYADLTSLTYFFSKLKSYFAINDHNHKTKDIADGTACFVSGMILIWSGYQTDIPNGFSLCNGQNGTPNLVDRFVICAGGNFLPGSVGGEQTHMLTESEFPKHNHVVTLEDAGSHSHTIGTDKDAYISSSNTGWSVHGASSGSEYMNGSTNYSGDHTHIATVSYSGGSSPHNNMPPYYALCYIMKI